MPTPPQWLCDKWTWEYWTRHGLPMYAVYLICTLIGMVVADAICIVLGVYDNENRPA